MLKKLLPLLAALLAALAIAGCNFKIDPALIFGTPEPVDFTHASPEPAASDSPGPVFEASFTVRNGLDSVLTELYISPADMENWGDAVASLEPGAEAELAFYALAGASPEAGEGLFDIGAIDENGVNYDAFSVRIQDGDSVLLTGDWRSGVFRIAHRDGSTDFVTASVYWNTMESDPAAIDVRFGYASLPVNTAAGAIACSYSYPQLDAAAAEAYPQLSEAFGQLALEREAAVRKLAEKAANAPAETPDPDGNETPSQSASNGPVVETAILGRADEVIVSILFEANVNGETVFASAAFDPLTGARLHPSDIVTDVRALPHLLNTALKAKGSELEINEYRDHRGDFSADSAHYAFLLEKGGIRFCFNKNAFRSKAEDTPSVLLAYETDPFLIKPRFLLNR